MQTQSDPEPKYETLYDSGYRADFTDARDVLAFVFTPADAFIFGQQDPEERIAVEEILFAAKEEAIDRWRNARRCGGALR